MKNYLSGTPTGRVSGKQANLSRKPSKDRAGSTKRLGVGSKVKGKGKSISNDPRKRCSVCRERKKFIRKGTNPPVCIDCPYVSDKEIKKVNKSHVSKMYSIEIHRNGVFIGQYFIPWRRYYEMKKKVKEFKNENEKNSL